MYLPLLGLSIGFVQFIYADNWGFNDNKLQQQQKERSALEPWGCAASTCRRSRYDLLPTVTLQAAMTAQNAFCDDCSRSRDTFMQKYCKRSCTTCIALPVLRQRLCNDLSWDNAHILQGSARAFSMRANRTVETIRWSTWALTLLPVCFKHDHFGSCDYMLVSGGDAFRSDLSMENLKLQKSTDRQRC